MTNCLLSVWLLAGLFAPFAFAQPENEAVGRIAGSVIAEDGVLPPGATVTVHKMPEYVNVSHSGLSRYRLIPSSVRAPQTVPVTTAGDFEATGLPGGRYNLCANPADGFLPNCMWTGAVDVLLPPGSANIGQNIRVRRGGIVHVRLDDPESLLPDPSVYSETRATIGLISEDRTFRSAPLRSRDAVGRDFVMTAPFDRPFSLWVNPNKVGVQGPDGRTLVRAGSVATFQLSRVADTADFRLRVVTGVSP